MKTKQPRQATKQVLVGLFDRQIDALNEIVQTKGLSRSLLIRVALDAWLSATRGGKLYDGPSIPKP